MSSKKTVKRNYAVLSALFRVLFVLGDLLAVAGVLCFLYGYNTLYTNSQILSGYKEGYILTESFLSAAKEMITFCDTLRWAMIVLVSVAGVLWLVSWLLSRRLANLQRGIVSTMSEQDSHIIDEDEDINADSEDFEEEVDEEIE